MKKRVSRTRKTGTRVFGGAWSLLRKQWIWLPLLLLSAAGGGFAIGTWQHLCADCPSVAQIRTWEPQQTSKVLSHDGQLLGELGVERRTPVSIVALPPHVPDAFIAIEDRRFYRHQGFDPRGLARAIAARFIPDPVFRLFLGTSLRTGGASTITQQLARNIFDAIGFEVSLERKLKELQVAFELERAYSKDQILEAYMNEIYLGPGWYGVQTASRNYFGKDAVELNPAEAALLAAVGNNAGLYSPFRYPERAEARRNLVLDRMALEGFLTEPDAELWKEHALPTQTTAAAEGSAPYFVEWVRQLLQDRFGSQLYTGGYQITTTLDVGMQRAAEVAMARGFERIESRPGFPHTTYVEFVEEADGGLLLDVETPYVQGMFIAMDPLTGGVRAMIGGRDFTHSKFNRAVQAMRQPGSSFKPIVYSAALASGIPASRIIADRAFVQEQVSGELWTPENFSDEFEGNMTLRHAFRTSVNTVAIRLAFEEVGVETVAQNARRLGIRTPIPRVPSIAIGSAEVLPIQMIEAYSVFATLGTKVQPISVVRVESPDGEIVWEPEAERVQVMEATAARLMVTLMEDVVNLGTGGAVRSRAGLPYSVPAAGKTGTTNESTDVWFNGFTPNLQAVVWFGMDQPQPLYAGATSGEATPVWGEFMRLVYLGEFAGEEELTAEALLGQGEEPLGDPEAIFVDEEVEVEDAEVVAVVAFDEEGEDGARPLLQTPERWTVDGLTSLEVDSETGLLASPWCPAERRYTEYYLPGTEPSEECDDTAPGPSILQWPW